MKIHTSTKAKEDAGQKISSLLKEYAGAPVLLMLSGGSARDVLEYIDLEDITESVTIALVDERLNVKGVDSNAWQLVQTDWFQSTKKRGSKPCHLEQGALKDWRAQNSNGKIITLLGMGPDGHTAGILPMPEHQELFKSLFIDTDNWVTEYVHESTDNPFKERVTITARFLITEVDDIIVYEVGEDKCKRLNSLKQEYAPHIEPADILTRLEKVDVYTDCS